MKKVLLTLIVSITLCGSLFAQYPETHWPEFYSGEWEEYVAITAFIQIDNHFITELDNWANMEIASFCGDECRGTAFMMNLMDEGDPYPIVALPFWFDSDSATSEVASFKLYNHSTGTEYNIWTCNYQITGGDDDYIQIYLSNYDEAVVINFFTPQTIELVAGFNWISTYVEITLDDLKAALVETLPGTTIRIYSKSDGSTTYNGSRWRGLLNTLDMSQMYMIETTADGELTLEGLPIVPANHPITIANGVNWIAFPFSQSMSISNAFAGFALSGDRIYSKSDGNTTYNGSRWRGTLDTFVPGQGYMYESTTARIFTYPNGSSKALHNLTTGKAKAKMPRTTERTK